MRFLSGFESTHIFGSGTDVLNLTKHTELVEEDLNLVDSCGLDLMRYSAPWHSIERKKNVYDWEWLDKAMKRFRDLGIEVILDPASSHELSRMACRRFCKSEICRFVFEIR